MGNFVKNRNLPTRGRIAQAITQEVSIVTDPANADEFLVKNKNGQVAGEVSTGMINRLSKLGFQFTNDEETSNVEVEGEELTKVDEASAEGENDADLTDVNVKIAKLMTGIVELESTIETLPEAEEMDKAGVKRKTQRPQLLKVMDEMVRKLTEILTDAGLIGEAAASQVASAVAARDSNKRVLSPPKGDGSDGKLPRPMDSSEPVMAAEDSNTYAAVHKNVDTPEAIAEVENDSPQETVEPVSKSDEVKPAPAITDPDFGDKLIKSLNDTFKDVLSNMVEEQQTVVTKADEKNDEVVVEIEKSTDPEIAKLEEQIAKNSAVIEQEQSALVDEEAQAKRDATIQELQKKLASQEEDIARMKKMRFGSNGLDLEDESSNDLSPGAEKHEMEKIYEGSVIGAFSEGFKALHNLPKTGFKNY